MTKRKKSERKKIKKKEKSVENVKRKKSNHNLAPILIIKWPNFSSCQNPFKLGHFCSRPFFLPLFNIQTHCSSVKRINFFRMAKSESKSGWEAVKPTKTKPAKAAEKTDQKSKSPPKAKIVANTSPKENQKSKPDVSVFNPYP